MRCIGIFNNRIPQDEMDLPQRHSCPFPHFMGSEYRELKELTPNYVVMKQPTVSFLFSEPDSATPIPLQSMKFNLVQTALDEENHIAYGMYLEEV